VTDARFSLNGSEHGVSVVDRDTGMTTGPFDSALDAADEADSLESSAVVSELAEQIEEDGLNGLAREIRRGLGLDVALARLKDIDMERSDPAGRIQEVREELQRASDERRRWPP